mgnify:CR=1 FL=1
MSESINIAIDGPAASGKTTVGKIVARELKCRFLDTGTMYRAVAWSAIQNNIELTDRPSLISMASLLKIKLVGQGSDEKLLVDGIDITEQTKNEQVDNTVSVVAMISGVRRELVCQQRRIASDGPIVMAGRDIGTVVLPEAEIKIYLEASVKLRAVRRYRELLSKGSNVDLALVQADLQRRDEIDQSRSDSPLKPSPESVLIHTDSLNIQSVAEKILLLASRY